MQILTHRQLRVTKFSNSHLNFTQLQRGRDLTALRQAKVFFGVKFPFQLQELFRGEGSSSPARFGTVFVRSVGSRTVIGRFRVRCTVWSRFIIVRAWFRISLIQFWWEEKIGKFCGFSNIMNFISIEACMFK